MDTNDNDVHDDSNSTQHDDVNLSNASSESNNFLEFVTSPEHNIINPVIGNMIHLLPGLIHHVAEELLDSSDDEASSPWGGSRPGKAPNKARDFEGAARNLHRLYFAPDCVYNNADFERRFRMSRAVFETIRSRIIGKGCFVQGYDALKKQGIDPLVRLVACLRVLAYGTCCDSQDEFLQISESTLSESLPQFMELIISEFGPQYLNRSPTDAELERILAINKTRGFPGLFASWDCKHFQWKNCPVRLAGQHQGKEGMPTLILEAICDADLFIYYSFFGEAGSQNDINILDKSTIVAAILSGDLDLKTAPYTINGTERDWMYFLVDGIYPSWSIFINTIKAPIAPEEFHFKSSQEAVRKDIERAFGTVVQRFQILQRPIRLWKPSVVANTVDCCIILHNMIVESRRHTYSVSQYATGYIDASVNDNTLEVLIQQRPLSIFGSTDVYSTYDMLQDAVALHRLEAMEASFADHNVQRRLKADLVEHLWNLK